MRRDIPFLHGADYNPEQWLAEPEVLAEDIRLMKKAKINCVSLGMFSWSQLEPREGEYHFDWLADIIDDLYHNGIYTILATPSGARPAWLAQKYPEVLRMDADGRKRHFGGRHNHCFTSEKYRQKVSRINQKLSEKFGEHPGVLMWHISNEYSGTCYCPACVEAFRKWLRNKYKTIEKLNHEWWTAFWSHTYSEWDQIEPPFDNGEQELQGLFLDWQRFSTDQTVDFMKTEKQAIRCGGSSLPVTTNMMEFLFDLNYYKFEEVLEVASWDSYPRWNGELEENLMQAARTACFHDLMRCLKGKPFLLMESTPGAVNWREASRLKRPGMHMLEGMLAVAHGADSIQYFQWRKSRGGYEKFHGAVVDHIGIANTRTFTEVAREGERLLKISSLCGSMPSVRAALIFDWENMWALHYSSGPRNCGIRYLEIVLNHYMALWKQGVAVDVIGVNKPLGDYQLVCAPMLYMQTAEMAEKLKEYVASGGTLVGGCMHGVVNENDLCWLGGVPYNMREVFGLTVEEVDGLLEGETNSVEWKGRHYRAEEICERLILNQAQNQGIYQEDFYKGESAIAWNRYGEGEAWYIGTRLEKSFYQDFYKDLVEKEQIPKAIKGELPEGVIAAKRGNVVFVQNFNQTEQEITLYERWWNWETNQKLVGQVMIEPYQTLLITEAPLISV